MVKEMSGRGTTGLRISSNLLDALDALEEKDKEIARLNQEAIDDKRTYEANIADVAHHRDNLAREHMMLVTDLSHFAGRDDCADAIRPPVMEILKRENHW